LLMQDFASESSFEVTFRACFQKQNSPGPELAAGFLQV